MLNDVVHMLMNVLYFQYVSKVKSWNIFRKAFSDVQSTQALYHAKLACTDFIIDHYAGEVSIYVVMINHWLTLVSFPMNIFSCNFFVQVQYQSVQFLDKNKDDVVPEHQELLCASRCSFIVGFPLHLSRNQSNHLSLLVLILRLC